MSADNELIQHKMAPTPTTKPFVLLTAATACLIAFSGGTTFSWASPMLPKLTNPLETPLKVVLTSSETSWIAALLTLGGAFGPLVAGRVADKIGRKRTLLLLALPGLISFTICAFTTHLYLFYFARFFNGLSAGSVFTVLPLYLVEIAENHNRGLITSILPVSTTCGMLISYVIGPSLSVQNFNLVCLLPLVAFIIIFSIWFPETPTYLAMIDDQPNLLKSLKLLRAKSGSQLVKEMEEINLSVRDGAKQGQVCDFFKQRALRRALTLMLGLMLLQQMAGINAVLSYMQTIFAATGSSLSAETSTMLVGGVQVLTTFVTASLVERLGRKSLLLMSAAGCWLALTALGAFFQLQALGYQMGGVAWLPIASLLVYIVAFNLGLGGVPWTIMTEVFPESVKSIGSTMASSFVFFVGFVITLAFPGLAAALGMGWLFWFFGAFAFGAVVFVGCLVPETRGRTLAEIQGILSGGKN